MEGRVCCWQELALGEGTSAAQTNLFNKRRLRAKEQFFFPLQSLEMHAFLFTSASRYRKETPSTREICFITKHRLMYIVL